MSSNFVDAPVKQCWVCHERPYFLLSFRFAIMRNNPLYTADSENQFNKADGAVMVHLKDCQGRKSNSPQYISSYTLFNKKQYNCDTQTYCDYRFKHVTLTFSLRTP